jgi:hypothetical protein
MLRAMMDAMPPKLRKPVLPGMSPSAGGSRAGSADAAFDIWLQRGLREVYGEVAEEPIPPEILALIENSRKS